MAEKPILFNGEMVRAILDGRETQTRRPVKWPVMSRSDGSKQRIFTAYNVAEMNQLLRERQRHPLRQIKSPYALGDLLYVRETWALATGHTGDPCCAVRYRADGEIRSLTVPKVTANFGSNLSISDKWRPSVHMPKWAARIWLRVTSVRVEQVRDITDEDVIAEGIRSGVMTARDAIGELWSEICESCERNDWVWVYEFERTEAPR